MDIAHDSWLYLVFGAIIWLPTTAVIVTMPITATHRFDLAIEGEDWLWLYGYYIVVLWILFAQVFVYGRGVARSAWHLFLAAMIAAAIIGSKEGNWKLLDAIDSKLPHFPHEMEFDYAALMGVTALAVASAARIVDQIVSDYSVPAILRRSIGTVSPPQSAAMVLVELLGDFYGTQKDWTQPATRRQLVAILRAAEKEIPRRLTQCAKACGARRKELAEVRLRSWHFSRALHAHRLAIINATSRDDFRRCVDVMAQQAADLSKGDWQSVTQEEEPKLRSRIGLAAKRLAPAALLTMTAIGLPLMPGLSADTSGVRGLQVALLVAAALTLVAADASARDPILAVLRDAAKRGPT